MDKQAPHMTKMKMILELAELDYNWTYSEKYGLRSLHLAKATEYEPYPSHYVKEDMNDELVESNEIQYIRFRLMLIDENYLRICHLFFCEKNVYEKASDLYPSSKEAIEFLSLPPGHWFNQQLINRNLNVGQKKTPMINIFYNFRDQCEGGKDDEDDEEYDLDEVAPEPEFVDKYMTKAIENSIQTAKNPNICNDVQLASGIEASLQGSQKDRGINQTQLEPEPATAALCAVLIPAAVAPPEIDSIAKT